MGRFRELLRARQQDGPATTLFYSSDVHGCELAWRKFLSTPKAYGASLLVMGGDLTGKALVPILEQPGGEWHAYDRGDRPSVLRSADELASLIDNLSVNGFYSSICDAPTLERLRSDEGFRSQTFEAAISARLREWIELADRRLAGWTGSAWIMPGNDDDFFVDQHLDGDSVHNCADRVVDAGGYPMVSLDWVNPTPWSTPREDSEDALAKRIARLVDGLDMSKTIFNFHAPPFGTSLDVGPAVRPDLTVEKDAGEVKRVPIGSHAVREAIERHQPLLSLHGHVHESPGIERIGRTVSVNPGSRYNEGVLDGALIKLDDATVRSCQLVAG